MLKYTPRDIELVHSPTNFTLSPGTSYFGRAQIPTDKTLSRTLFKVQLNDALSTIKITLLTESVLFIRKKDEEPIVLETGVEIDLSDGDEISVLGKYVYTVLLEVRDGRKREREWGDERLGERKRFRDVVDLIMDGGSGKEKREKEDVKDGRDQEEEDLLLAISLSEKGESERGRKEDVDPSEIDKLVREIEEQERQSRLEQEEKDRIFALQFMSEIPIDANPPVSKLTQEEEDLKFALSLQGTTCEICFDDYDIDFLHTLTLCKHVLCRDCIADYLKNAIDSRKLPILCPFRDCSEDVLDIDLELLLDKKYIDQYQEYSVTTVIENDSLYRHCLTPDCKYAFFKMAGDDDKFRCPTCKKTYCLECKVDYHEGFTCKQYEEWSVENGSADLRTMEFLKGQKWKQCQSCNRWIEKNKGCKHMTCLCGNEFCYICEGVWPCDDSDCEEPRPPPHRVIAGTRPRTSRRSRGSRRR